MTAKKISKTTAKKTKAGKIKAGKSATAEKPIKAGAAKAPAKKVAAKKIVQKKAVAKKSSAKKVASKKPVAKAAEKKTAIGKTAVAKRPVAKKIAAKNAAPAKAVSTRSVSKKALPKKVSAAKSASKAGPLTETKIKTPVKPKTAGKKASARKLPVVQPQAASTPKAAVLAAPVQKPIAPPRHKANPEAPRAGSVVRVRQTVARGPLPGAAPGAERPKATTIAKPIAGARNLRLVARPKSSRSPARGLGAGAVTALAAPGRDAKPRVVPDVPLSEEKLRQNIRISIFFLEAWLRSGSADSTPDLIEMAGAAEAARSQIWRWLDQAAQFQDGRTIDAVSFEKALHHEMLALREDLGDMVFNAGLFQTASELFVNLALAPDFHDFPDHVTTH